MLTTLLKKIRYNILFHYYRYRLPPNTLYEATSRYSHIRVKQDGSKRRLVYVKQVNDNQIEYTQSDRDMLDPLNLSMEYTRLIFSSLLFFPDLTGIKRILMIGLGGGVFCPVIREYLPHAVLDIVEIDEMIVDMARRYFDFKESANVNLYIADGREFIEKTDRRYDLVLSDPYLIIGDNYEVPGRLRTVEYYRSLKAILNEGGIYSANIFVEDRLLAQEIKTISSLFGPTYFFTGKSNNSAIVACHSPDITYSKDDLIKAALKLEGRHRFSFRPTDLAQSLDENISMRDGEILTDEGISV